MTPRFLLAAFFFLLLSVPSAAQVRSEDPRTNSRVHAGPLYLSPSFTLREFGVDTNVFNARGERQKDFTFTVAPSLTTAVPFARRGQLRLLTAADLVYYQKFKSERSINPQISLRGEAYFNRLTLFAEPSYLRTRQRPSYEIDLRSRRVQQGTTAGFEWRVLPKLSGEFSVEQSRLTYDADEIFLGSNLAELLNRSSWTYAGRGRWEVTPLTTFVVSVESGKDRFLQSPLRDSDSTSVTAGVDLKPRALIAGTARMGVRRFNALDTRMSDFTGLVASGSVAYTLLGATTFMGTVERDVQYSFEPLYPYYVATSFGVGVRRQLVGRFDALLGFDRSRYAYRELLGDPGTASSSLSSGFVRTRDAYSGSIGYRVGQSGRLGVGVSYWTRSDRDRFDDYSGLRVGTSFTYGI